MHNNKSATLSATTTQPPVDRESQYKLRNMAEHMEAFFRCIPAIQAIHITAQGATIDIEVDGNMTPERRTTVINSVKVAARSSGCFVATNPDFEPGVAPYRVFNPVIEGVLSRTFTPNSVWESMRAALPRADAPAAEDVLLAHIQQVYVAHAEAPVSYGVA
jgi:hypothetical protein